MPQFPYYDSTLYGVIQKVPTATPGIYANARFIDPNAAPTPFPTRKRQATPKKKAQANDRIVNTGGFVGPTTFNGAVPQEGQPGFVGPVQGGFVGPVIDSNAGGFVGPTHWTPAFEEAVNAGMQAIQRGAQNWDNSGAAGMPAEYDPPMFGPIFTLPQRGFLSYIQDVLNNYNSADVY